MKPIKEGQKKASCLYLDSEIKLIGFMISKAKDLSFSEYVEMLIVQDCLKNIELLEGRKVDNNE